METGITVLLIVGGLVIGLLTLAVIVCVVLMAIEMGVSK